MDISTGGNKETEGKEGKKSGPNFKVAKIRQSTQTLCKRRRPARLHRIPAAARELSSRRCGASSLNRQCEFSLREKAPTASKKLQLYNPTTTSKGRGYDLDI